MVWSHRSHVTEFEARVFECPELLVLPLICPPLLPHESLIVASALPVNSISRFPADGANQASFRFLLLLL